MATYEENKRILSAIEDRMLDPLEDDFQDECKHIWVFKGSNRHGSYYRCRNCGREEEL